MPDTTSTPGQPGLLVRSSPDWPWHLVPAAVFAALAAITIGWLAQDRAPLVADQARDIFSAVDFINYPLDELTRKEQLYPPLVHIALAIGLTVTGYHTDSAIAVVNLSFLALLLASTYLLGLRLFSPKVGAVAVSLLALYPAIYIHAHTPLLDLPLTAMVAASLLALLRSDGFSHRAWAVAFGLLAGLGWLTKQTFVFAVAGPLLLTLIDARHDRRRLRNAALAAAIAGAISLSWYAPRADWIFGDYRDIARAVARERNDPHTLSLFGAVYYFVGMWHQTSLVLALAWVAALPLFLRSRRRAFLLSWWLGTVLLTSTLEIKDSRYLMPALPALALMTAYILTRTRWLAPALVSIVAFGVVQLWAVSFGIDALPHGDVVFNRVERHETPQWFSQTYRLSLSNSSRVDRSGWGIAAGLSDLRGHIGVIGHPFVYEAIRLPRLVDDTRTGHATTVVEITTCADVIGKRFDYVLIEIGGANSVPADALATCAAGLQEVRRLPLSMENLLPGAAQLIVFKTGFR